MAHEQLVAIRTFMNSIEAELARSALEAAGIDCMVLTDDAGGQEPPLQMTGGVQILVRAENAPDAEAVLGAGLQDAADHEER